MKKKNKKENRKRKMKSKSKQIQINKKQEMHAKKKTVQYYENKCSENETTIKKLETNQINYRQSKQNTK